MTSLLRGNYRRHLAMLTTSLWITASCSPVGDEVRSEIHAGLRPTLGEQNLSSSEALSALEPYCGQGRAAYLERVMKTVHVQAGYLEFFDGSGYVFPVAKGPASSGGSGYFRSGEGDMVSDNGNGFFPPSERFNLAQVFDAECAVARRTLEGTGGYSTVKAARGSVTGEIAHRQISGTGCMQLEMTQPRLRHRFFIAFCPDMLITSAIGEGAGAASRADTLYVSPTSAPGQSW